MCLNVFKNSMRQGKLLVKNIFERVQAG